MAPVSTSHLTQSCGSTPNETCGLCGLILEPRRFGLHEESPELLAFKHRLTSRVRETMTLYQAAPDRVGFDCSGEFYSYGYDNTERNWLMDILCLASDAMTSR